ncbi:MAG: MATE family efflux transporter [Gemmobacter sp.]
MSGGWAATKAQVPGILGLSVPIIAGLAASTLIGVTDSVMLAPLGPVPLAAVGLTGAVAVILYASVYGVMSALSVRIGVAWGAGEGRTIPGLLRNGLALGAGVGVLAALTMATLWPLLPWMGQPDEVLAAMPAYYACIALYMIPFAILTGFKSAFEAVGRPWLGTALAFLAVVVNVPLNYALIWGIGPLPPFGLTGAGIASFLAETAALAVAWVFWARARSMRRLRLRRDLSVADMRATAVEGAPLGLMYLAETGAVAVATLIIGTFGTVALAGNQVAFAIGGVLYMVPLGVAGAVAIRVAQERGAGNDAAQRPVVFAALGLVTVWLTGSAALLGFGGAWLAGLVTDDAAVAQAAVAMMLVFALMQVFDGVQSAMVGALRGMSDAAWGARISMIAYWPVGVPLGWLLAHEAGIGPAGVWLGWLVALAWAGAMLTWRFLARTRLSMGTVPL